MNEEKLPETLNRTEIRELLNQPSKNTPTGLRNYVIIYTFITTGLRASELVHLAPKDIDLERNKIHVRHGKGAKDRVIPFDPETETTLRLWKEKRNSLDGIKGSRYFFSTLKGGQLKTAYLRQMLARYAKRAGLERRVHPHMLRHTYAVERLRLGFNLREVQTLLGHKRIETTMIYAKIYNGDIERKMNELPGLQSLLQP